MRRFLTTLMILLVVIVAGLSALVLLVNPNDFRDYLITQVANRSGYQLKLEGPLRWHVWPQLSILSGRMTLTEPGARAPLVRADNMRLDVALLPLLSHQLQVHQVMLKGAVIELTPQTAAVRDGSAPVPPRENLLPQEQGDRGWSFDISNLQVADSVLVFQRAGDEQITVRDIRLQMQQDEHQQASIEFAGRVNRDQRDLTVSFNAQVNAGDYPHTLDATFDQINWQLQGADLPVQGIAGNGSVQMQWQEEEKKLSFSQLRFTANDSALRGEGSVVLADKPVWSVNLQADNLNLDNLLSRVTATAVNPAGQQVQSPQSPQRPQRPVIAASDSQPDYASLRGYRADFHLKANQAQWRGLNFSHVSAQANNLYGLLTISELQAGLGEGSISLPGTLDARNSIPLASFQPVVKNVQISSILKAFNYSLDLTGTLSLTGGVSGNKINAESFRHDWQGQARVELRNSLARGLNFQQLVQHAVERSANVKATEDYESATRLELFTCEMTLDRGNLSLGDMSGKSPVLAFTGQGWMDLVREESDMLFNVRVLEGWQGESKLVETLKATAIPLRVYGNWSALNYSLKVDQVLRKSLKDEVRSRLQQWAEKNQDSQAGKDLNQWLDKR